MASALDKGKPVLYPGFLDYGNGANKMPTGITMTARTPTRVLFENEYVANKAERQVTC